MTARTATSLLVALSLVATALGETRPQVVRVDVDTARPVRTISKYLTGSHFVYAFERDALYKDERIADWMRKSKIGVIRWPGGTAVQNYHWDNLNGIAFKEDSWDPAYNAVAADPKDYMDLDEYIAFCRRVGAEPMVGVNIKSGMKYDREEEALDEARRLITYCKDRQYGVKHWYIGNECFKGFGARKYAQYLDRYAEVLRSVDPDIVIIGDWKFGPESKDRFKEAVEIASTSKHLDVLEIHEKWGNDWSLTPGRTRADWLSECPLYRGELGRYIRAFHEAMKESGRSRVKLAFNEWGVGGVSDGDEFDYAMVAADFLVELFRNDIHQACYWNLNMGSMNSRVLATSADRSSLLKLNPVAHVFEMYAHALEKELYEVTSPDPCVYGFAAGGADGVLHLYLLNKRAESVRIKLHLKSVVAGDTDVLVETFATPGVIRRVDSAAGAIELGPCSFNRIEMKNGPF